LIDPMVEEVGLVPSYSYRVVVVMDVIASLPCMTTYLL
jgi:hypothetical protein